MTRTALVLPLLALFGCPGKEEVMCTEIAIASVIVNVSTEGGETVAPTVTYTVDGAEPVACESFSAGQYTCGYEVDGDITVLVTADGYQDVEETVTVGLTEDGCHVSTETVDAVLVPEDVDCTDVEMPSVIATVVGSSGEALTGVSVSYTAVEADIDASCDGPGTDGEYVCGTEIPGTLHVTAVADGHAEETVTVEVGVTEDECHVVTEAITFELDWLED